ncbi:MAG TPA: response regulator, partial [Gemmatimonadaceae bacterium]
RALRKLGYTVFGATGAREAIPIAREHSGTLDLLLTDLTMPEMNGRDLAAELQRIVPGLTCIFMSGYSSDSMFLDDVPGASRHFIAKPFAISELTATVRSVLDSVQGG